MRLRASGICNMFGRGATIFTPFLVVSLFTRHGISGVLALMIGLLTIRIIAVVTMGIEPSKRRLEEVNVMNAKGEVAQPPRYAAPAA